MKCEGEYKDGTRAVKHEYKNTSSVFSGLFLYDKFNGIKVKIFLEQIIFQQILFRVEK